MKTISHSPQAVNEAPMCLYSKGAISEQYNQINPCHDHPKTKSRQKIMATAAQFTAELPPTATRVVKAIRMIVEAHAP